ncbi:hypothetical protein PsorP6_015453 [Peronosclerospora sorghi]|uniref:Uncharacterized protein n=1 Tax=Peronosclerospora sorghi TaxID=230839 RepID=A0ACC0WMJ9_9STRA|nr:hypothetical protein PsorP6_015453 [Peronosclerospora sorghi]
MLPQIHFKPQHRLERNLLHRFQVLNYLALLLGASHTQDVTERSLRLLAVSLSLGASFLLHVSVVLSDMFTLYREFLLFIMRSRSLTALAGLAFVLLVVYLSFSDALLPPSPRYLSSPAAGASAALAIHPTPNALEVQPPRGLDTR